MALCGASLFLALAGASGSRAAQQREPASVLSPHNEVAPFCYRPGHKNVWPIAVRGAAPDLTPEFRALRDGAVLAQGRSLAFEGVRLGWTRDGELELDLSSGSPRAPFRVEVRAGGSPTQNLEFRPAPPLRPISYYSDFGDELIGFFHDSGTGHFRATTQDAFDQYFRRMQAHGVSRLILWLSPYPYIADRANYDPTDWKEYEAQATAMLNSPELSAVIRRPGRVNSWAWVSHLMAMRRFPEFGPMVSRSAVKHGIKLAVSFRPFEPAVSKYYDIPRFEESGRSLGSFFPMANPLVNRRPDQVGFANYRLLLQRAGAGERAEAAAVRLRGAGNLDRFLKRFAERGDNLRVIASPFAPMQHDGFILIRRADGSYRMGRFGEIERAAGAQQLRWDRLKVERGADSTLLISGLRLPAESRYLWLTNPSGDAADALDLPADSPLELLSASGERLGRINTYWSSSGAAADEVATRVAGITADDGGFSSPFYATEAAGQRAAAGPPVRRLGSERIVVDRGDLWCTELLDLNRPAARSLIVRELRTLLKLEAFDEIFLNTRSHTQLAASDADGSKGVRSVARYRSERDFFYQHLGLDRAYGQVELAEDPEFRRLARGSREDREKIATWQPGEWTGVCQQPSTPYRWRWLRNRAVAAGLRKLAQELEQAFPTTRIRAVIPESERVQTPTEDLLQRLRKPDGTPYGRTYYRSIWNSNNMIPSIGEGMAMLDLSGTRVEPVFEGIRLLPDMEPFRAFVRLQIADLADNRGSSYRGPRSYFYEGHESLSYEGDGTPTTPVKESHRAGREERICHLLAQRGEIGEVILYEADAWARFLPLKDPDFCGYGFLDRCPALKSGL